MSETALTTEQDPLFQRLLAYAAMEMERLHVPGVAIGLLDEGQEYVGGLGVTNMDHPLPVNAQTLFQIGSITKTMTATAAMRLVEQGHLQLDTPIRQYLPDLHLQDGAITQQVTLRHLFTHTGGWTDEIADTGLGDDALAKMVAQMDTLPQMASLGSVWSYNNSGFSLAGRVIEVVTGKVYEEALRELLLDPLEMTQSFFFAHEVMTARFAVGHEVQEAQPVVARPWAVPRSEHPAGGVISSVNDQLRYARFHLGNGSGPEGVRLLSPESLQDMQSPQVPVGDEIDAIGLSWWLKQVGGVQTVQHVGATHGQMSVLLLVPQRGFAFTSLTNADSGRELNNQVAKWVFQNYLGIREPEPTSVRLPPEKLAAYVGRYSSGRVDLELRLVNGELVMHLTARQPVREQDAPSSLLMPPMRLAFLGEDVVIALDPPLKEVRGSFLRNTEGRLAWFRFGQVYKHEET